MFLLFSAWEAFVHEKTNQWADLAIKWISAIRQGGVIHYENLLTNRDFYLRKLMHLLEREVNEERLNCVIRHDPVAFKRASSLSL